MSDRLCCSVHCGARVEQAEAARYEGDAMAQAEPAMRPLQCKALPLAG